MKARVEQSMPFEVTGVDFTGALYMRGEGEYGIVNTCKYVVAAVFLL